jgi:putative transposase
VKTIRLKVKHEAYTWLNDAAIEVNHVWNWTAEYCRSRIRNGLGAPSGFELTYLTKGCAAKFPRITIDVIQQVVQRYATQRRIVGREKLRWRVSSGPRRSLGWVPVKGQALTRKGNALRMSGKTFRVFERERLQKWKSGSFSQDACGDWWLCLPVESSAEQAVESREAVGVDLGLTTIATTSDGDTLDAGRWTRVHADRLACAQRRGHKRQAKRIHRKAARCRADALHKFSTSLVKRYQRIYVGDVSSSKLVKTRMAKSVLDSGWGMLKAQIQYKGERAGRCVEVVDERSTSVTCSACGSLSGPRGVNGLAVRSWVCADCGESHDRDCNAALNILFRGEASPSVRERGSTTNAGPRSWLQSRDAAILRRLGGQTT